ncbi:RNA-binding protein pop5 [Mactra antiquata]
MVRYKCRYVLCKVIHDDRKKSFDESDIYFAVRNEVEALHGDYGVSSMKKTPSLSVKYTDKESGIVLLKCQRGLHKLLQSSLPFIKKIKGVPAFLQTIHVGGTIRSCLKFLITYHKSRLSSLLKQCTTKEEKEKVKVAILKCCQDTTQMVMTVQ